MRKNRDFFYAIQLGMTETIRLKIMQIVRPNVQKDPSCTKGEKKKIKRGARL